MTLYIPAAAPPHVGHREQGRSQPYLIVGAGKLGQQQLTLIKAWQIERRGAPSEHLKLRVYDSAAQIAPIYVHGRPVGLEPDVEFIRINDAPLRPLWEERKDHPVLQRYFELLGSRPVFEPLEDGAGQNRVLSLLALAHNFSPKVLPSLRSALQELTAATRVDWLHTPGVLQLADGWGAHASGLLLALNAAIRLAAEEEGLDLRESPFLALVALPGGSQQATALSDANTWGLLLELAHYQEHGGLELSFPPRWVARCPEAPFQYVVIAGVQGAANSQLASSEQLGQMLAEAALLLVDSPVGNAQRGFARDHREHLRGRGVRGDLACFSNVSVVAAEFRREPFVQALVAIGASQLTRHLLADPTAAPPAAAALGQIARSTVLPSLIQDPDGRPYLPNCVDDAKRVLRRERTRDQRLSERIRKLFESYEATRLPWVAKQSEQRIAALWAAAERAVAQEVERLLDAGHANAAEVFLQQAIETIDKAVLVPPEDVEPAVKAAEARLEEAVRQLVIKPGRRNTIDEAVEDLLGARKELLKVRALRMAALQWEVARQQQRAHLDDRRGEIDGLLAQLRIVSQEAASVQAEAAARALRADDAHQPGADELLRHRIVARHDLWRAYGESLWGSTEAALSPEASQALLRRLGSLTPLVRLAAGKLTEVLSAAVAPSFQAWASRTVEEVLGWQGQDQDQHLLGRLRQLAVERWRYNAALLKDGQHPHAVFVLGVTDRDSSRFADARDLETVSTGDPERIVLARLSLGLPASALTMWPRYARAASECAGHPIHNLPGFVASQTRLPAEARPPQPQPAPLRAVPGQEAESEPSEDSAESLSAERRVRVQARLRALRPHLTPPKQRANGA
ncbi:MAG: hypothetical protein HY690_06195 [Chloroflexi bacterium]|nr:hypothetical protein [Chloroflexota bacterium]